jgi:hypothetical protein
MEKRNGLLELKLLDTFSSGFPVENGYFGYISSCVGLEGTLACAAFFAPELIEYEGAILLASNIDNDVGNISTRFGSSKKQIEQYNNLVCLSEFFAFSEGESTDDDLLMDEFGKVIVHYWTNHLKQVYPGKLFEFLLDENLFDEDGLCVSFFEV